MYKLFQIKKYNVKQDSIKTKTSDDIDDISKIVSSKNNGYHLKLFSNENYVIFGDVDHIEHNKTFKLILEKLSIYFKVDVNDINYTKSKKENELSYHWSINSLYTTLENIKLVMNEF